MWDQIRLHLTLFIVGYLLVLCGFLGALLYLPCLGKFFHITCMEIMWGRERVFGTVLTKVAPVMAGHAIFPAGGALNGGVAGGG